MNVRGITSGGANEKPAQAMGRTSRRSSRDALAPKPPRTWTAPHRVTTAPVPCAVRGDGVRANGAQSAGRGWAVHALRVLLFAARAPIRASYTGYSGKAPPKVVDGVIDVAGWDFEKHRTIPLEDEWTVRWDLLPDANGQLPTAAADASFFVPGLVRDKHPSQAWAHETGTRPCSSMCAERPRTRP